MNQDNTYSRKMTPVRVMEDADGIKVIFLESARFYSLDVANPEFESILAILRRAIEKSEAVEVSTESIESDVITTVSDHP